MIIEMTKMTKQFKFIMTWPDVPSASPFCSFFFFLNFPGPTMFGGGDACPV